MRNILATMGIALFVAFSPAHAGGIGNQNSGSHYDWQSGNSYNWNRDSMGNTKVRGFNSRTGSNWNTRIDRQGNMRGFDSQGNYWNYNDSTGTYQNFGTGEICTGTGSFRTCR